MTAIEMNELGFWFHSLHSMIRLRRIGDRLLNAVATACSYIVAVKEAVLSEYGFRSSDISST